MVWCTDVLADKPHPRFDTKLFSKKVWLIRYFDKVNAALKMLAKHYNLTLFAWVAKVVQI